MRLPGSAAFVTGAAQGLGKAFSESLLQRGARVCLTDVQTTKGKSVEDEFRTKYGKDKVTFLECDVRSVNSLSSAFKKATSMFGTIDLMVNNAGIGNESKYIEMIEINLTGVITATGLAVEHMRMDRGGKGGTIINVASTAGLTPVYCSPSYAATKYGVFGFTRSWATNPHLGEIGIQFAALCPSFTSTAIMDFQEGASLHQEDIPAIVEMIGVNEVEDVVKGFLELVEKEKCNGDVMTVTPQGIQYKINGQKRKSHL